MIHHSKALEKEITDDEYQFDRTYTGETTPSETLSLIYVEITEISDNHTCDISLESPSLGDYRFYSLLSSDIHR